MNLFTRGLKNFVFGGVTSGPSPNHLEPLDISSTILWDRDFLLGSISLQREYDKHEETLRAHWTAKSVQKQLPEPEMADEIAMLRALGFAAFAAVTTREQARDVLGLIQAPTLYQIEVLSFFKVPLYGVSRTLGALTSYRLLKDALNANAWADRPATQTQRAVAQLLTVDLAANLNAERTEESLDSAMSRLKSGALEMRQALVLKEIVQWYLRPDVCAEFDLLAVSPSDAIAVFFYLKRKQIDPFEVFLWPRKYLERSRQA